MLNAVDQVFRPVSATVEIAHGTLRLHGMLSRPSEPCGVVLSAHGCASGRLLNRQAFAQLRAEKHLEIVPRADHLFEQPGVLEAAENLATDWFLRRLCGGRRRA